MRSIVRTALFVGCVVASAHGSAAEPAVKIEFRFGTWEALDGFTPVKEPGGTRTLYIPDEPDLTNADIAASKLVSSEDGQSYEVEITFRDDGARKMNDLSGVHRMQPLAILIDDKLIAAPRIAGRLGRKALVAATFSREEAQRIAAGIVARPKP